MTTGISVEDFETKYVNNVYHNFAVSRLSRHNNTSNQSDDRQYRSRDNGSIQVQEFLRSFARGSVIADLGCGHGQYLQIKDHFILGIEKCALLCENVKRLDGNEAVSADAACLSLRSNSCDGVVCVGVIHHLATTKRRLKVLREISRILRPGGQAFLSVWGIEATFKQFAGCDVLVPTKRKVDDRMPSTTKSLLLSNNTNSTGIDNERDKDTADGYLQEKLFQDHLSRELRNFRDNLFKNPFKDDELNNISSVLSGGWESICSFFNKHMLRENTCDRSTTTTTPNSDHRYYHVFTQKEFIELILKVKHFRILDTFHDKSNWVFILTKK